MMTMTGKYMVGFNNLVPVKGKKNSTGLMKRGSHSVNVPGPHRALTGSTCPMWHLSYARCAQHSSGLKYVAEGGFPSISESTSHENYSSYKDVQELLQ